MASLAELRKQMYDLFTKYNIDLTKIHDDVKKIMLAYGEKCVEEPKNQIINLEKKLVHLQTEMGLQIAKKHKIAAGKVNVPHTPSPEQQEELKNKIFLTDGTKKQITEILSYGITEKKPKAPGNESPKVMQKEPEKKSDPSFTIPKKWTPAPPLRERRNTDV